MSKSLSAEALDYFHTENTWVVAKVPDDEENLLAQWQQLFPSMELHPFTGPNLVSSGSNNAASLVVSLTPLDKHEQREEHDVDSTRLRQFVLTVHSLPILIRLINMHMLRRSTQRSQFNVLLTFGSDDLEAKLLEPWSDLGDARTSTPTHDNGARIDLRACGTAIASKRIKVQNLHRANVEHDTYLITACKWAIDMGNKLSASNQYPLARNFLDWSNLFACLAKETSFPPSEMMSSEL